MAAGKVWIHLSGARLADGGAGIRGIFRRLHEGLSERGCDVRYTRRSRWRLRLAGVFGRDYHIVEQGRNAAPNMLNVGLAHIYPFWQVDVRGLYGHSSTAAASFEPDRVDATEAARFRDILHARWVEPRKSRLPQPPAGSVPLPRGAIAVFLQRETCWDMQVFQHMTQEQMVAAVIAHRGNRPVLVKCHPGTPADSAFARRIKALDDPASGVHVVNANIHDMIDAADLVACVTSAVGIEAMLHGKPVLAFGRADYHHNTTAVRQAEDLPAAMASALARPSRDAAYLHWYLAERCVNGGHPELIDHVLLRILEGGYDLARLGLVPPMAPPSALPGSARFAAGTATGS